jgi:sRNA-binding regulator protein Hfq
MRDSYNRHAPHRPRGGAKPPSDKTFLETQYIIQLVRNKTPLVIKLKTNEEVRGYIQYYDKNFIRVTCPDGARYFIFKHDIKYFYEEPAS